MHPATHSHVLQLDLQGTPQAWISLEQAAIHVASGSVAWVDGAGPLATLRGGFNVACGCQSLIEVHPIIALAGASKRNLFDIVPAFAKTKLFRRDLFICSEKSYSSIPIHFFRGVLQSGVAGFSNKPIRAWRAPPSQGPR
ncbi:MAG: hypothetical protein O9321_20885, partial [Rubrivivax sp.]|nr:hypothetical protein [Rubrivivax sp.]